MRQAIKDDRVTGFMSVSQRVVILHAESEDAGAIEDDAGDGELAGDVGGPAVN